jgi:hypothetical protein
MEVKYDNSGRIDVPSLELLLPNTPKIILEDFFSDHGRNEQFQEQYSNIKISLLKWKKIRVRALDIINCGYYLGFSNWINTRKHRVINFQELGWHSIDDRLEVVLYWQKYNTWITPPIFFDGKLLLSKSEFWLVEGHTRIGILMGLVEQCIVSHNSIHEIWYANY